MKEATILSNAITQSKKTLKITKEEFIEPYSEVQWTADFIKDFSRQIMITGGRRGCKTTSCSAKIGYTNLFFKPEVSDGYIFYAGKTFDHALDLMWPKLAGLKQYFGLEDWNMNNKSTGRIITPRGDIRLLGFNDMDAVAKAMGMPFKLFILDESQEYRDDILRCVIRDGASWGSLDHGGTLIIAGNPHRKKHSFYSQEWLHNDSVKKYHTNIHSNPVLTAIEKEEFLEEQRDLRGLTKETEDAEFKRMAYGEWIFDESDQIFTTSIKNYFDKLPSAAYNYIIGVDVGYSAYDAIAVLAYTYGTKLKPIGDIYLVEEFQKKKMDMRQLSEKVHEIAQKWGVRDIVIDTGALVVKVLPEIVQRYSQYSWIPAEKKQKMMWIETLKAEMNRGTFKMRKGCIFDKEIPLIEYSDDRKGLNERLHHSDILMAVAYPFRYIYNFVALNDGVPEEGSKERLIRDMKKQSEFSDEWEHSGNKDFEDW